MAEMSSCGVVNPSSANQRSGVKYLSEDDILELRTLLGEATKIRRLIGNVEATTRRILESKGS